MSDERMEELGLPRRAFLKKAAAAAFAAPVIVSFALDGVAEAHQSLPNQTQMLPNQSHPNQSHPNQCHPNQAWPNQTVPNQSVGNQTFNRLHRHHRHHHDDQGGAPSVTE